MLTNAPGCSAPVQSNRAADVVQPLQGLDPLLRRTQRVRRLHVQDRRLHLDLGDQVVDAERRPASLGDLAAQRVEGVADQGLDVGPAVHAGHRLQQVLAGQGAQRQREPVARADVAGRPSAVAASIISPLTSMLTCGTPQRWSSSPSTPRV